MENPKDTLERITQGARAFRARLPEVKAPYEELNGQAYLDGELAAKEKRLMALCAAVVQGCTGCMLFQAEEALAQGATVQQIMETLGVALALGGSMASSKTAQVMGLLREKGLVEY